MQRFQIAFPCDLVEQPHILDGDHGLVGEGLQQLRPDALKTGRGSCG